MGSACKTHAEGLARVDWMSIRAPLETDMRVLAKASKHRILRVLKPQTSAACVYDALRTQTSAFAGDRLAIN